MIYKVLLICLLYSFFTLSAREHRFFQARIPVNSQLQGLVCALKITKNKIKGSCSAYDGSPAIEVIGLALPDGRFLINKANNTNTSIIIEKANEIGKNQVVRYDELGSLKDQELVQMVLPGETETIINHATVFLDNTYYMYLILRNSNTKKESTYLLKLNSNLQVLQSKEIPHFSTDTKHSDLPVTLEPIHLFKKEVLSLVIQSQPELEKRYIFNIQTLSVLASYSPLDESSSLVLKGYLAKKTTAQFLTEYYSASKESIKQRQIVKNQSFKIKLESLGTVPFFTVQEGSCSKASFFTTTKDAFISFQFPNFYGNQWCIDSIDAITTTDLNKDGQEDLLIMGKAMTGIGQQGAVPFKILGIYLYDTEMLFKRDPEIEKTINEKCAGFKKIRQVVNCFNNLSAK